VAGATTLLAGGLGLADNAYHKPSLHVALETAIAVIVIVAAHLVHGRFRQSLAKRDLILFYALATLAVVNLVFSALPAALARTYPDGFATWAPPVGTFVAAALLCVAATGGAARVERSWQRKLDRFAAGVIVVAVIGAAAALIALGRLATTGVPALPSRWGLAEVGEHPEVILGALAAALFFLAGALFTKRAAEGREELMMWLAVGSVVAGFARLNYFFFPSLYTDWIYAGDILRVAFYVLLFLGAAREISAYQKRAAQAAVLEERRRMARDLHDGLAQELAYIASQTKRLASLTAEFVHDQAQLDHLVTAAERALDESRRAIAALTQPIYQPLHIAVRQEAQEVAARVGVELDLDLDPTIDVDPATRETVLRIVREAVSNAGRHGHAAHISVQLTNGRGLHLRVTDDGEGFDPVVLPGRGFGLLSMEERASALGGKFRLASHPGRGTEIEVVLP
jgi:signal transduction histidine kinase